MKVLQINTSVNFGSTGRIAEDLGILLISYDHESYIAYGRGFNESKSEIIKVGNKFHFVQHVIKTRIFDLHGFGSKQATRKLIKRVETISPDMIHLHNIHGYFLNVEILFNYLARKRTPAVWTFHDCWPFTGHCSYFDAVDCYKWQKECSKCPNLKGYPKSWIIDNSRNNFHRKKELFNCIDNLHIVTPSKWLANHVEQSFLKRFPVKIINNGVDLRIFKPHEFSVELKEKYGFSNSKFILGVANTWDSRKGLSDFIKFRKLLAKEIDIVLVGLKESQIEKLPEGIIGIQRTKNTQELAVLYSSASVFVNPTYVDNFPTTNIEALSCGTPVVTYNTGGSPEAIDFNTGAVVARGDIEAAIASIQDILNNGKDNYINYCRDRAEKLFDKNKRFKDYIDLYEDIIRNSQ